MDGYYIYSRYIFCWENVLQSQQRAWNHIEVLFRQNAFIKSFDQYKARHAITSFIARLSLRVFKTIIKLIKVKTDFLFPAQKKSFFLVCIIILATKLMQGKSLRCKKGETFWEVSIIIIVQLEKHNYSWRIAILKRIFRIFLKNMLFRSL